MFELWGIFQELELREGLLDFMHTSIKILRSVILDWKEILVIIIYLIQTVLVIERVKVYILHYHNLSRQTNIIVKVIKEYNKN